MNIDYEALILIWGVIQPLLIKGAAEGIGGKDLHGFWKWFIIIFLSVASGWFVWGQSGQNTNGGLVWIIIRIVGYSLASWNGFWKKVYPKKDNPLTPEDEGVEEEYEISYNTPDGTKVIRVMAKDYKDAMLKAMKKIRRSYG